MPQYFLSHVELGKTYADPKKCNSWGLSVWMTEAAVAHARQVFPKLFGKQHITRVDLVPSDGTVMSTPSHTQPAHHTFWKAHNLDLTTRCKIAFGPEVAVK